MRPSLQGRAPRYHQAWAALYALLAAGEAWVVFAAARHGFDFTDEGFYLNSIAQDSEGSSPTSSFGRVYRLVTLPFDGDVLALRWFNIVVILLAGSVLGWALLSRGRSEEQTDRWTAAGVAVAVAVAVAASTLGFFGTGLLTPSYNSLAATGVLLVASGLVLACGHQPTRGHTRVAALLIGLGGLTTYLGKPSSAMAIAVVAGVGLLAAGATSRRVAPPAMAIGGLGLLATSWAMTGSPIGLVRQLKGAVEDAQALDAGHGLASAVTAFGLPETSDRAIMLSLALAAATFAWTRGWLSSGTRKVGWLIVSAFATAYVAYSLVGQVGGPVSFFVPTRALVILSAPAGVILAALTTRRRPDRATSVLAITLCLLPHAWIFGSNNDYWQSASLLYVLWFAGGFVLVRAQPGHRSAAPAIATTAPMLLLTAAVIASVLATPYRQVVPLFAQDTSTRVGASATLRLAPDFARAIDGFRGAASTAGFTPGTPILDLTGQMPGLIFAIEGSAAGAPWILGGYPGSDAVARRTLSRTSCSTLAKAWLILEPDGTRQIDPSVLAAMGATVVDWAPVASEQISTVQATSRRITLLRPTGSPEERRTGCEAAR